MKKVANASLKQKLDNKEMIIAPGVYEMVSALSADRKGFDALYLTGYGLAASYLGLPDAGVASYGEVVSRVACISQGTQTPIIADADTGYGGLLNVDRTVRGYEQAGAAALQLEDQEFPKKCGHTPGRRVIPVEDMVSKIKVAKEARESSDFLIIARTDARTGYGLDEALRRMEAYAKAGADILFVESPESEEEMEKICSSFDLPTMANMVEGGLTPVLSKERLQEMGFSLVIYPSTALLGATAAYENIYEEFKLKGTSLAGKTPLAPIEAMHNLLGFEQVWEFDKKWQSSDDL